MREIEKEVFPMPFDPDKLAERQVPWDDLMDNEGEREERESGADDLMGDEEEEGEQPGESREGQGEASNPLPPRNKHKRYEVLKRIMMAEVAAFLSGPPGWGKSTAASWIAQDLGLRFRSISVCAQTTASSLVGYRDANGRYCGTGFRECYEHGGVFLLDELDSGNENVLTILNGSLSNSQYNFPDGSQISKHPDFRLIATGNTWGDGATSEFTGRQVIDEATLNRFAYLEWIEDSDWEQRLTSNLEWTRRVQAFRSAARAIKLKHLISPRATIFGAKLLAVGLPQDTVETLVVRRNLDQVSWMKLKDQLKPQKVTHHGR